MSAQGKSYLSSAILILFIGVLVAAQTAASQDTPQNPSPAAQLYAKGRAEYLKFSPRGFQEALSLYNQAVQADPKFAPAYAGIGEVYSVMGYYRFEDREEYEGFFNESYKNIKKAMSLDRNKRECRRALALNYLHLRRFKEAEGVAQYLIALDPNDAESLYILWAASGRDPESPSIKRVLELNPSLALAHLDLGKMYFFKKGNYANAVKSYERAAQLSPDSPIVRNYLGTGLRTQGQLEKAKSQYIKSIELDPNYAAPYMNLGITFYYLGKFAESIDYQQKAIALNPRYPDSYYFLGLAYHRANNRGEAIKNYEKFIALTTSQDRYLAYIQSAKENVSRLYEAPEGNQ
ncbi:MAG: tetratricopeptide repeat protein [Deltaproteobacteria bacterium]